MSIIIMCCVVVVLDVSSFSNFIADFQLLSLIGRGGYGEVYLCRKIDTKEILVLKRMKKATFTANKNEVYLHFYVLVVLCYCLLFIFLFYFIFIIFYINFVSWD